MATLAAQIENQQQLQQVNSSCLIDASSEVKVQRPTDHKTALSSLQMAPQPPPRAIDTTTFQNRDPLVRKSHISLDGSTGSGSVPSSPPPPYPPYYSSLDELTVTSAKYLSSYSPSPAKMEQLQGLLSSLHGIMNDQSFAQGDLKNQLNEIQSVIDRVTPRKDSMTADERQILLKTQMMKNLAEDVIATKAPLGDRIANVANTLGPNNRLSDSGTLLALPALGSRLFEPTEAPPSTARTPPPSTIHSTVFARGHLRHSSSASFSTSSAIDQQYTLEREELSPRPSSSNSSYRRRLKKQSRQSLRQLEGPNDGRSTHRETESNAAFDRICSLLTELITDASTAVSTTPDGTPMPSNIPMPQFTALVPSDSDSSEESCSDLDAIELDGNSNQANETGENPAVLSKEALERAEFLRRLRGRDNRFQPSEETEGDFGLDPEIMAQPKVVLHRRASKASNRPQSSLFLELQNTEQKSLGASLEDLTTGYLSASLETELKRDRSPGRRPRSIHVPLALSTPSRRSSIRKPMSISKSADQIAPTDAPTSPVESIRSTWSSRPRSSASWTLQVQESSTAADAEVQQVLQGADSELDRTVETIDGLTRDLVAVATHQNLMQIKLQKTLQSQKQQLEDIDLSYSAMESAQALTRELQGSSGSIQDNEEQQQHQQQQSSSRLDYLSNHNHLMDLSRNLKQVAVSVGKVLASSSSAVHRSKSQNSSEVEGMDKRPQTENLALGMSTRFGGNDFSRYFQELEKIAALGGKLGLGNGKSSERDDELDRVLMENDIFEESRHKGRAYSGHSGHTSSESTEASASGGRTSTIHSRRGSASSVAPPELEDFAAQCRLLTRALVLPFVQLTHHAMTSQDSALALAPRSSRFTDLARDPGLEVLRENSESIEEEILPRRKRDRSFAESMSSSSERLYSSTHDSPLLSSQDSSSHSRESIRTSPAPVWTAALSASGRELESLFKSNGELSPDAMVKAKTFVMTGLYLIHMLYWTVLFVVGTLVLDPWLAETAGQQVVRIVDQVREALEEVQCGSRMHSIEDRRHALVVEESDHESDALETDPFFLDLDTDSIYSKRTPTRTREEQRPEDASSGVTLRSGLVYSPQLPPTSLMRAASLAGPTRRRRKDSGTQGRFRRVSNAKYTTQPTVIPRTTATLTATSTTTTSSRRERPLSHWGVFESGLTSTSSSSATLSEWAATTGITSSTTVAPIRKTTISFTSTSPTLLRQTSSRRNSMLKKNWISIPP